MTMTMTNLSIPQFSGNYNVYDRPGTIIRPDRPACVIDDSNLSVGLCQVNDDDNDNENGNDKFIHFSIQCK